MAYAMMAVINQQVQFDAVGLASVQPATMQTMLSNAPTNDGVAHLFEFTINDATGLVISATMDKSPVTIT